MGRSVSYLNDAVEVAYVDVSNFGYTTEFKCTECGAYADDECTECTECGGSIEEVKDYNDFFAQDEWESFIDNIKYTLKGKFKTLYNSDEWEGRECHIILENQYAIVAISDYCGLASISVSCNYEYDGWDDKNLTGLAERYTENVGAFIVEQFGEYKKIGSFSNGEGVFEKVA
jgi:hypothetical protein